VSFIPRPKAPVVETGAARNVTYTTATLEGRIRNNAKACDFGFSYWTEGEGVFTSTWEFGVDGPQTFKIALSGLRADTTYSYQAHAYNTAGSSGGMVKTFTTPGLLPADLSQNAPHVLRIESIHDREGWTRTVDLIYQNGATEGAKDTQDSRYVIGAGIYWELLSRVGSDYLKKDARPPASMTPFHIEQGNFSVAYQGQVNGGTGVTNALRFSLPLESKGTFGGRLLLFQEYTPSAADADVPDPNAHTFPIYYLRALMADGNGVGTIPLPALPRRPYVGPIHWFVLRTDRVSLADFNGDRVVDANDYAVVLRDLGEVGNSMADIASMKDGKLVIGIPDGKVDDTDVAAFEQELARYQALCAAVYGSQGHCGGNPSGVQGVHILTTYTLIGGSVTVPGEGSFVYDHGASVSVMATSEAGYGFVNWTGSAVRKGKVADPNAPSTTVTVDADYTLQANFVPLPQVTTHTLMVSSSPGGSVSSPGVGLFTYNQGASVPIVASPQAGYGFVNWTGSAVQAGRVADPSASSTTVIVDADYTVQAEFVQTEPNAGGTTLPVPDASWVVPDLGIAMHYVEAGTFQMGSNSGESDEKPVHTVRISKGYWTGQCEVTQSQYQTLMGTNPSQHVGPDLPVEKISWNNAVAFCQKLTDRERGAGRLPAGYSYRLPTEAQWEYAARGGTKGAGFDYAGSNDLGTVAWYYTNSAGMSHSVGQKVPNELGLHDMSGNVSEWCSDWYAAGYYASSPQADPQGPLGGTSRVYRGGGWNDSPTWCRSAGRPSVEPTFAARTLGMRVVLSPD